MIYTYLKKISKNYTINGIIIYCGITNNNELIFNDIHIELPIKTKYYYCDKIFHTEFLDKFINHENEKNKFLVMYVDGTSTYYYEKFLTQMKQLQHISFDRQKKQRKGGQSAPRIGRLCMEKINSFTNKSILILNDYINNHNYKSIIIAGNGDIIDGIKKRMNNDNINYIKIVDKNLLITECEKIISFNNCNDDINKISEYYDIMKTNSDLLLYGINNILANIENIKEILIHKESKYYDLLKSYNNICIVNSNHMQFLDNFEGIIAKLYFVNMFNEID